MIIYFHLLLLHLHPSLLCSITYICFEYMPNIFKYVFNENKNKIISLSFFFFLPSVSPRYYCCNPFHVHTAHTLELMSFFSDHYYYYVCAHEHMCMHTHKYTDSPNLINSPNTCHNIISLVYKLLSLCSIL